MAMSMARRDIFSGVPVEHPKTMGQRVRMARKTRNLTQVQLTRAAGIDQSTLSAIENDKTHKPEARTILALASALGLTAQYLLHGRVSMASSTQLLEACQEIHDALTPENRAAWFAAGRALVASQRPPDDPKPPSGKRPPRPPRR